MDVEVRAQVFVGHGRALQVPAGAAAAPRGIPRRRGGLALLVSLPQREVAGIALAAGIGVRGVLHVLHALPGEFAVAGPRTDVEVDVAGIVECGVRVPGVDQLLDQRVHLRDMARGPGFVRGGLDTERGVGPPEHTLEPVGQRPPRFARVVTLVVVLERGVRVGQDLVVDVRHVAHRGDLIATEAQPAGQDVEHERGTHVADVRCALHRGTAVVEARLAGSHGDEVLDGRGSGVVEAQSHPASLTGWRRTLAAGGFGRPALLAGSPRWTRPVCWVAAGGLGRRPFGLSRAGTRSRWRSPRDPRPGP